MRTFELAGREMRLVSELPAGVILEMADASVRQETMAQMAAMYRLLRTVVIDEDQKLLDEALHDRSLTVDLFTQQFEALIEAYTDRPTERPSGSPDGADPTGPSSKVVSFARGTVEAVDPSSTDGPQRA